MTSNMDPKGVLDGRSALTGKTSAKLTRGQLRALEERNPYQFIEKALMGAK